jgi:hypothetical protein
MSGGTVKTLAAQLAATGIQMGPQSTVNTARWTQSKITLDLRAMLTGARTAVEAKLNGSVRYGAFEPGMEVSVKTEKDASTYAFQVRVVRVVDKTSEARLVQVVLTKPNAGLAKFTSAKICPDPDEEPTPLTLSFDGAISGLVGLVRTYDEKARERDAKAKAVPSSADPNFNLAEAARKKADVDLTAAKTELEEALRKISPVALPRGFVANATEATKMLDVFFDRITEEATLNAVADKRNASSSTIPSVSRDTVDPVQTALADARRVRDQMNVWDLAQKSIGPSGAAGEWEWFCRFVQDARAAQFIDESAVGRFYAEINEWVKRVQSPAAQESRKSLKAAAVNSLASLGFAAQPIPAADRTMLMGMRKAIEERLHNKKPYAVFEPWEKQPGGTSFHVLVVDNDDAARLVEVTLAKPMSGAAATLKDAMYSDSAARAIAALAIEYDKKLKLPQVAAEPARKKAEADLVSAKQGLDKSLAKLTPFSVTPDQATLATGGPAARAVVFRMVNEFMRRINEEATLRAVFEQLKPIAGTLSEAKTLVQSAIVGAKEARQKASVWEKAKTSASAGDWALFCTFVQEPIAAQFIDKSAVGMFSKDSAAWVSKGQNTTAQASRQIHRASALASIEPLLQSLGMDPLPPGSVLLEAAKGMLLMKQSAEETKKAAQDAIKRYEADPKTTKDDMVKRYNDALDAARLWQQTAQAAKDQGAIKEATEALADFTNARSYMDVLIAAREAQGGNPAAGDTDLNRLKGDAVKAEQALKAALENLPPGVVTATTETQLEELRVAMIRAFDAVVQTADTSGVSKDVVAAATAERLRVTATFPKRRQGPAAQGDTAARTEDLILALEQAKKALSGATEALVGVTQAVDRAINAATGQKTPPPPDQSMRI